MASLISGLDLERHRTVERVMDGPEEEEAERKENPLAEAGAEIGLEIGGRVVVSSVDDAAVVAAEAAGGMAAGATEIALGAAQTAVEVSGAAAAAAVRVAGAVVAGILEGL